MVCKVHLEGRGNSDCRKVKDLGPHFRRESQHLFFETPLLPSGLCLLFLIKVAKNLAVCTFKDERDRIRGLLST
jgi:hypothetical protein